MITYVTGDILQSNEKVIVHGTNCSGGFGSGIAGQIAKFYPEAKIGYLNAYKHGATKLGELIPVTINNGVTIVNACTQQHYGLVDKGPYVSYPAIRYVMHKLARFYPDGFAIPMIGAGLAGGNWEIIEKIINEETPTTPVRVYILNR